MISNIEDKKSDVIAAVSSSDVADILADGIEEVCNFKNDCSGFEVKFITIKEYYKKLQSGKVNSNASYQRGFKNSWLKPSYRSAVLDSIMRGFSIGVIYVVELKNGDWELIDGKQRSNFISITLKSLDGSGFEGLEDEGLNKIFAEWEEEDQAKFLAYKIPFIVFNGMADSDRRLQFERLSAGVKLTKMESRRGLILNVVNLPDVKEASKNILSVLPDVAGRSPSSDTAEEIVLQALSFLSADNYDFKGYEVIKALKSANFEAVKKSARLINERADSLVLMKEEDQEEFKIKWLWKKSVLNCLLCVSPDEDKFYQTLNFEAFKKLAGYVAGKDQEDFKNFSANNTASSINVKGRIEILKKVQSGKASKNIEDVKVKKEAKKVDKGFGLGDGSNPSYTLPDDKSDQFGKMWGSEVASIEAINAVCKYIAGKEGSLKSVRALKSKLGVNQFSYAVNGKIAVVALEAVYSPDVVKKEEVKISPVNIR